MDNMNCPNKNYGTVNNQS